MTSIAIILFLALAVACVILGIGACIRGRIVVAFAYVIATSVLLAVPFTIVLEAAK